MKIPTRCRRFLRSCDREYDKDSGKTPDCEELVARVQQAERRGAVLLQRRWAAGDQFGNPSTTVGYLTREIREADERARR